MKLRFFTTKQALLLKRSLDVYSRQHEAISKNVANAGNPNFRRVNTDFSQVLKSVNRSAVKATRSHHIHASHFRGNGSLSGSRAGGQGVEITKEMADLAVNQIKYDFAARMLARLYRGLRTSIIGRNR